MGRPIKSTLMSATTDSGGDGTSGRLAVTAYYPSGGSLQQNDDSFIIDELILSIKKFLSKRNSKGVFFIE